MSYDIHKILTFASAPQTREYEEIYAAACHFGELIDAHAPDCANKVHALSMLRDVMQCTNWALNQAAPEAQALEKTKETNTPGVPG